MKFNISKSIMGINVEIFNVLTKFDNSFFVKIEGEQVYAGKSIESAEKKAEELVVEHLKKKT